MTTDDRGEKGRKRDIAIQHINKRFTAARRVVPGISKGAQGVTALAVFDFIPMVKMLPGKNVVVVCEDVIEDELLGKKI